MRKIAYLFLFSTLTMVGQGVVSEAHELYNGDIYLPGTLTYPESNNPLPLVIFIHGSGNADRNGNQGALASANHIKQLADSLNTKGIAFYCYDKRNATPANREKIKMEDASIRDLAEDVKIAIATFKDDPRFASIYLVGHSQGSLVGMLAAANNVTGYISVAGPGTTIDKALIRQLTAQNEDAGKVTAAHIKELMETDTIKEVNIMLMAIFAPQNQRYLKEWIMIDPVNEIRKLKVPVLIVNGDADFQVTVEDAQLLKQAKPNAQLVIVKNMNHMLKTVENDSENQQSYYNSDFPLSTSLVKAITEFIRTNG